MVKTARGYQGIESGYAATKGLAEVITPPGQVTSSDVLVTGLKEREIALVAAFILR